MEQLQGSVTHGFFLRPPKGLASSHLHTSAQQLPLSSSPPPLHPDLECCVPQAQLLPGQGWDLMLLCNSETRYTGAQLAFALVVSLHVWAKSFFSKM